MTKIGLTLGKFAPLHAGHQYMIETAIREMDEVIVVIYDCPETTDVPLSIRADWIKNLYPTVNIMEAWDGPTEIGETPEIKKKQEDYILNMLGNQKITHFYSSEFYGDHMSQALGAINRQVDPNRNTYPISGTLIRKSPFENRNYLNPIIYRDLISKIAILGAPSTGKTTISQALAKEYNTVWMPEYGREYWGLHQINRRLTLQQLVEIAEGHILREEKLTLEANNHLFVDTNAITTYMFSLYYHGKALPMLTELAKQAATRYDLVFICNDDIPFENSWDRSGDVQRKIFQKQIIADLLQRKIPFILLPGTIEERINKTKEILQKYRKYQSLGNTEHPL